MFNRWTTRMAKLLNAIKSWTAAPEPEDNGVLRRRLRELEAENKILREKLAWRGPWIF